MRITLEHVPRFTSYKISALILAVIGIVIAHFLHVAIEFTLPTIVVILVLRTRRGQQTRCLPMKNAVCVRRTIVENAAHRQLQIM